MPLGLFQKPVYDELASTAKAFGEAMVRFGAKYKNAVILDSNAGKSLNLGLFARTFPDRYFHFGNSVSNMIGASAGFTVRGKIPFLCSPPMLLTGRAWELVRNAIAYPYLNVKLIGFGGGFSAPEEGATHQSFEDIALMRAIPNMKVVSPADTVEARLVVEAMMNDYGPTYVRLSSKPNVNVYDDAHVFVFGRGDVYRPGTDVCIFSYGDAFHSSLEAAQLLERDGISTMVVNLASIKSLDENLVIECAKQAARVVTVEDHQISGGLGSAVMEALCANYPMKVTRLGMDSFGESGKRADLLRKYQLDGEGVYEAIKRLYF